MSTKKFFSKEVKIALSFIIALTILVVGINFLKGINVFTPTNHYFLKFPSIQGLVVSNGVYIKGYKVGQVRTIEYDFSDSENPFVVNFAINKDITIPQGTIAYLFDESLMGGKGINIVFSNENNMHSSGDTLNCDIDMGLLGSMTEMVPQLQNVISRVDSLLVSVHTLVNSDEINSSLKNLNSISNNLNSATNSLDRVLKTDIPAFLNKTDLLLNNLNSVSNDLTNVKFADISVKVDSTLNNLNLFTKKLNSPNSSLGLLMNDKKLYYNLESTAKSADNLLIDLKANPHRYVNFSIWGRKEKQEKK